MGRQHRGFIRLRARGRSKTSVHDPAHHSLHRGAARAHAWAAHRFIVLWNERVPGPSRCTIEAKARLRGLRRLILGDLNCPDVHVLGRPAHATFRSIVDWFVSQFTRSPAGATRPEARVRPLWRGRATPPRTVCPLGRYARRRDRRVDAGRVFRCHLRAQARTGPPAVSPGTDGCSPSQQVRAADPAPGWRGARLLEGRFDEPRRGLGDAGRFVAAEIRRQGATRCASRWRTKGGADADAGDASIRTGFSRTRWRSNRCRETCPSSPTASPGARWATVRRRSMRARQRAR